MPLRYILSLRSKTTTLRAGSTVCGGLRFANPLQVKEQVPQGRLIL